MPNFFVHPTTQAKDDGFWVYGVDEWDARNQIAHTLRLDAHNESVFSCREDTRFKVPLNLILHATGEWTEVATPAQLRCSEFDGSDGPENPEV
jgi:hypothetical protein